VQEQISCDIRRLVEALPDNQREVIELRYYKDLSFKEIADLTNVSINTALGRMRYAILNMRRMAEQYNIALTL
jgi:RNA polymerase sigma-70 factor (ECF subfamily)